MKNKLPFLIFGILLCLSSPVSTSPVNELEITVLIDTRHGTRPFFAEYLEDKGFHVIEIPSAQEITKGWLGVRNVKLVIIRNVQNAYTDDEIAEIEDWVRAGGRILALLEVTSSSWKHYEAYSPAYTAHMNELLEPFNIRVDDEWAFDPKEGGGEGGLELPVQSAHPLFQNVESLYFSYYKDSWFDIWESYRTYGCALRLTLGPESNALFWIYGNPVMAARDYDRGRVFVTGFDLCNQWGFPIEKSDNAVFFHNLVVWLTEGLVLPELSLSVDSAKDRIEVDEYFVASCILENKGNGTAYEVHASIDTPQISSLAPSQVETINLRNLDPGASQQFSWALKTSSAGVYDVEISLTANNIEGARQKLTFIVRERPRLFEIALGTFVLVVNPESLLFLIVGFAVGATLAIAIAKRRSRGKRIES